MMKRGHEPSNLVNLSKQEKAKEQTLPKSLQKEHNPANILILA